MFEIKGSFQFNYCNSTAGYLPIQSIVQKRPTISLLLSRPTRVLRKLASARKFLINKDVNAVPPTVSARRFNYFLRCSTYELLPKSPSNFYFETYLWRESRSPRERGGGREHRIYTDDKEGASARARIFLKTELRDHANRLTDSSTFELWNCYVYRSSEENGCTQ